MPPSLVLSAESHRAIARRSATSWGEVCRCLSANGRKPSGLRGRRGSFRSTLYRLLAAATLRLPFFDSPCSRKARRPRSERTRTGLTRAREYFFFFLPYVCIPSAAQQTPVPRSHRPWSVHLLRQPRSHRPWSVHLLRQPRSHRPWSVHLLRQPRSHRPWSVHLLRQPRSHRPWSVHLLRQPRSHRPWSVHLLRQPKARKQV